jgi:hypothetical protein
MIDVEQVPSTGKVMHLMQYTILYKFVYPEKQGACSRNAESYP